MLNFSSHTDCTFWCLFLFAFFLFARKSNLVPTTKKDLVNEKCLMRCLMQVYCIHVIDMLHLNITNMDEKKCTLYLINNF